MKILIIILLLSTKCYGQTTYDRKQDKRIDTLNWAIVKLMAISQQQDEKIKVLEDKLSRAVLFNKFTAIAPLKIYNDSIPNSVIIEYIKP